MTLSTTSSNVANTHSSLKYSPPCTGDISCDSGPVFNLRLTAFLEYVNETLRGPEVGQVLNQFQDLATPSKSSPKLTRAKIIEFLHLWDEQKKDSKTLSDESLRLSADDVSRLYAYVDESSSEIDKTEHPILAAADFGDAQVIKQLHLLGEPLDIRDSSGLTPVMLASRSNLLDAIQTLFELSADFKATAGKNGDNALHIAAYSGSNAVIPFLVSTAGINVDIKNQQGKTPLHFACAENRGEEVKTLLSLGANAKLPTSQGLHPIHIIAATDSVDAFASLAEHTGHTHFKEWVNEPIADSGETPLHLAAARGHSDMVAVLLSYGADPELADADRESPGFVAARNGHVNVLEVLHQGGAVLTSGRFTLRGETPFHVAALEGHTEVLRFLAKHIGEGTHAVDASGRNAAHYAVCNEGQSISNILSLLNELRVDIDLPDKEGVTPLHLAVSFGNILPIKTLLRHSAKVSSLTSDGYTPLDYAGFYNRPKVADHLLKLGVTINNNERELTTSHIAAACNNTDIIKVLRRHGADITSRDKNGYRPADWANKMGYPLAKNWFDNMAHQSASKL